MASKLQIVATLLAKSGKAEALREALVPAIGKFRNEPGCEGYIQLEDRKRERRFLTYETWADEAALAAHMKSPAMEALAPTMEKLLDGDIKQDFHSVLRSV